LINILKNKCANAYPKNYTLLVYARNPKIKIDTKKLFDEVQTLKVPFGEIWIIGSPDINKYIMFTVSPVINFIDFDLNTAFIKNQNQAQFITITMRGKGTGLEDIGQIYLPI
jgi:hypothetical protein